MLKVHLIAKKSLPPDPLHETNFASLSQASPAWPAFCFGQLATSPNVGTSGLAGLSGKIPKYLWNQTQLLKHPASGLLLMSAGHSLVYSCIPAALCPAKARFPVTSMSVAITALFKRRLQYARSYGSCCRQDGIMIQIKICFLVTQKFCAPNRHRNLNFKESKY